MPEIKVSFGEVVGDIVKAVPHNADAARIVRGLASAARTNWVQAAQSKLNTTARDYIQGISQPKELRPGVIEIELVGRIPNMVERGWPGPVDLRDVVIPNARTKKTSKEGHAHVHVPFRHGAPTSGKRNVGRRMPTPMHRLAKQLAPHKSHIEKGVFKEADASRLMPGMSHVGLKKVSKKAKEILNTKLQPWHTTSIYAGMVRQEKTYGKAVQSQYKTWRTISENPETMSDERKWRHPGIEARSLLKDVQDKLAKNLALILPAIASKR